MLRALIICYNRIHKSSSFHWYYWILPISVISGELGLFKILDRGDASKVFEEIYTRGYRYGT